MTGENEQAAVITDQEYVLLAADAAAWAAAEGPVPVDPDVAERMGAFVEDALSPEDALDSHVDGLSPAGGQEAGHE